MPSQDLPRDVHGHEINSANRALYIWADEVDAQIGGGASHLYEVSTGFDPHTGGKTPPLLRVEFQRGPIQEHGLNGVTNEALLAIVRDRLQCFQSGPFSCRENALALTKLEEALHWLNHRTTERTQRGVEGYSMT